MSSDTGVSTADSEKLEESIDKELADALQDALKRCVTSGMAAKEPQL